MFSTHLACNIDSTVMSIVYVANCFVQKCQRATVRENIFFSAWATKWSMSKLYGTTWDRGLENTKKKQQLTNRKHMLIFTIDPGAITKISLLVFFQLQIINQKVENQWDQLCITNKSCHVAEKHIPRPDTEIIRKKIIGYTDRGSWCWWRLKWWETAMTYNFYQLFIVIMINPFTQYIVCQQQQLKL